MTSQRELELWEKALQEYELMPPSLFLEAIQSDDWRVAWAGIRGIGLKKSDPSPLVKLITSNTVHLSNEDIRLQLSWALSQFGTDVRVDSISQIAEDYHKLSHGQRLVIADYLGERRSEDGIPALHRFMQDPSDEVALWAALSLAKIGEASLAAIQELVRRPSTLKLVRKGYLLNTLGRIGTPAAAAIADDMIRSDKALPEEYRELFREGLNCATDQ